MQRKKAPPAAPDQPRKFKLAYRPYEVPDAPPRDQQSRELTYDDPHGTHPEYGLTPDKLSAIFYEAECGYIAAQCDLFNGLRKGDGTLRNLYEQRRASVSSSPRTWQPDGTDGDSEIAAKVLDRAMRELPMKAVLEHQLSFNEFGFACTEIVWGVKIYDGKPWIVPVRMINVPHRRFYVDPKTDELRLITDRNRTTGEALEPGRWWVTIKPGARIANAGLGCTTAAFAMYKRWGTRDWVIYSEKFGVPLVLVKIPHNAHDTVKAVARSIVANIGTDGGAIVEVPDDGTVDVDIVKTDSADSSHTSAQLIAYCNSEVAKLIIGATLANDVSGSGTGSYAQATVHADRAWQNTLDDVETIQESQHCAIATPFVKWNSYAEGTLAPRMHVEVVRDQSPKAIREATKEAIELGVDVSVTQFRRTQGLQGPMGEGDSILEMLAAKSVAAAANQQAPEGGKGPPPTGKPPAEDDEDDPPPE